MAKQTLECSCRAARIARGHTAARPCGFPESTSLPPAGAPATSLGQAAGLPLPPPGAQLRFSLSAGAAPAALGLPNGSAECSSLRGRSAAAGQATARSMRRELSRARRLTSYTGSSRLALTFARPKHNMVSASEAKLDWCDLRKHRAQRCSRSNVTVKMQYGVHVGGPHLQRKTQRAHNGQAPHACPKAAQRLALPFHHHAGRWPEQAALRPGSACLAHRLRQVPQPPVDNQSIA